MAKVTVYIPTYNYARYVEKAVQSVLIQTMDEWELIIINDGSTDNTIDILKKYQDHPKIRVIDQENKGLNVTNNIALRLSSGKYIMRLDADDYLDENALLVLSNTLESKQEVDLVYPDYYLIDAYGEVIELVRRQKIEEEVHLLDLPAHGACTMFRTRVLKQIGGYIENFTCQDGYEVWLRFIQEHNPYNINIPLFYYRQHPDSLTQNQEKILDTRRKIKQRFVAEQYNGSVPKVLGIVPVIRRSVYPKNDPFIRLAGKPLLWYTLSQVEEARSLNKVVLSSDDEDVLTYSKKFPSVIPMKRDPNLARAGTRMKDITINLLNALKNQWGYEPDAVCTLYINTPLRKAHHIDWAVNTMKIFDVDTVISVQEELFHCYHHRKFGLAPIKNSASDLRIEREGIYKENGAIYLSKLSVFKKNRMIGKTVGHITMLPEESIKINSEYEFWLAEKLILEKEKFFDQNEK